MKNFDHMNKEVTMYIKAAPEDHQHIMEELRSLINKAVPGVKENFKWGRPVFSTVKDFAYLKAAKAYVTLGFFDFSKLEDRDEVLEGTGKDMRHIKIKKLSDIDKPLLTKWFKSFA